MTHSYSKLSNHVSQQRPEPQGPTAEVREALFLALSTLEGWDNYDNWVWPESALLQARQGTTEALTALHAVLARLPH